MGAAEGVPAPVESVFFMGTERDVVLMSLSTSIGVGVFIVAARTGCCRSCCGGSWLGKAGAGRDETAAGETGADVTEACC